MYLLYKYQAVLYFSYFEVWEPYSERFRTPSKSKPSLSFYFSLPVSFYFWMNCRIPPTTSVISSFPQLSPPSVPSKWSRKNTPDVAFLKVHEQQLRFWKYQLSWKHLDLMYVRVSLIIFSTTASGTCCIRPVLLTPLKASNTPWMRVYLSWLLLANALWTNLHISFFLTERDFVCAISEST